MIHLSEESNQRCAKVAVHLLISKKLTEDENAGNLSNSSVNKIADLILKGWLNAMDSMESDYGPEAMFSQVFSDPVPESHFSFDGDLAITIEPVNDLRGLNQAITQTVGTSGKHIVTLCVNPRWPVKWVKAREHDLRMLAFHEAVHVRDAEKEFKVKVSMAPKTRKDYLATREERQAHLSEIVSQLDQLRRKGYTFSQCLKRSPLWKEYETLVFSDPRYAKHRSKLLSKIAYWWKTWTPEWKLINQPSSPGSRTEEQDL